MGNKSRSNWSVRTTRRRNSTRAGRARDKWGSVIAGLDSAEQLYAWQFRHKNPIDPSKKVQRQFKPEFKVEACRWLAEGHKLIIMHKKGIKQWIHPTERVKAKATLQIAFGDFIRNEFVPGYRKSDNTPLAGSSKPNLRADCSHFLPSSEHLKVADIRPDTRFRWTANHSQAVPSTNMTHAGPRPPIPGRPPVPLVPRDLTDFDARHGGTLLPLTRLPAFSLNEGMPQTHQPQATINRGEPDK